MSTPLELSPEPRSVRVARTWVVDELAGIGRTDLTDAAELGVSELVTNAILHARPPIVVRLGGTAAHPRVEVHDSSVAPPTLRDMTDGAQLLATVGRGLGIVAMYSTSWGTELSPRGKVVWFEPAAEPEALSPDRRGSTVDVDRLVDDRAQPLAEPEQRVTIRLLGMPVRLFVHYRGWYDGLRRELRLLALHHGEDYPLAHEFSELTLRVEQERRQARGVDQLEAALASGQQQLDLAYDVPASAPATMTRLRDLLREVDVFLREERLLTAEAVDQQVALREWYLGEFERQGRGEPPVRWPGGPDVDET